MKLAVPQGLEGCALAPLMLEEFLLLVPQMLQMGEFAFQLATLLIESSLTEDAKAELGRGCSRFQLLQLCSVRLFDPVIELLDQMPHPQHLLGGGAQTQVLLVFHAL